MATIDIGDKKSFDVQLNIVPFIDLMSVLTAFLLVTAVWSDHAQLDVKPRVRSAGEPGQETPKISILLEPDRIYIGVSSLMIDPVVARAHDGAYDWDTVTAALAVLRNEEAFDGRRDIEIGVESTAARPVPYADLIAVMDVAAAAGFDGISVMAPTTLTSRPSL